MARETGPIQRILDAILRIPRSRSMIRILYMYRQARVVPMLLMAAGVAVVLTAIWFGLPPGPQGNASGAACSLLAASRVTSALDVRSLSSMEKVPSHNDSGTVNVCDYVGEEVFGRGGYTYARLYIAEYPSIVSSIREIRYFSRTWGLSTSDYVLEASLGVRPAWFCMTPPRYAPQQPLCLVAAQIAQNKLHMIGLFVSGKTDATKGTLVSLVQTVEQNQGDVDN